MTYSVPILLDLKDYKRPVLVFGWGVRLGNAAEAAVSFAEKTGIPVALTWGGIDIMPHNHLLHIGAFGTHANRAPNFAVQNADLILCVGSRLDSKSTGTPVESFAPKAKLIMVDLDMAEMEKFGSRVIEGYVMDALSFLMTTKVKVGYYGDWVKQIAKWKEKYPVCDEPAYRAVKAISDEAQEGDIIICDTGHSLAWTMQAWEVKKGQRLIHAFNNTPMGYGLPAAIGAAFANPEKRVVLIAGDGGLQLNIQEFATVAHHGLGITTYLLNNRGHGMCRQTQSQWMGGEFPSTSQGGGLACPDFGAIARAYGVRLIEISIPLESDLKPCIQFGRPIHDAHPLLDREELAEQML